MSNHERTRTTSPRYGWSAGKKADAVLRLLHGGQASASVTRGGHAGIAQVW
jgi:hypothetical protein